MGIEVDVKAIRFRTADMRRQTRRAVALQVVLPGVDRHAAAAALRAAMGQAFPDREAVRWSVYATAGGPCVWVGLTTRWKTVVEPLVEGLDAAGFSGRITAPGWVAVDDLMRGETVWPTLLMAFTITPAVTDGPYNQFGVPQYRWGVPEQVTEALIEDVADWVPLEGGQSEIWGDCPWLPATREDAAELAREFWPKTSEHFYLSSMTPDERRYRSVAPSFWGEVTFTNLDKDGSYVAVAESFIPLLVKHAEFLDQGAVRLAYPLFPSWGSTSGSSPWHFYRNVWDHYVEDVDGIYLLTTAHLDRANDLSGWSVTRAAPERWLVRARDLGDWYDTRPGSRFGMLACPTEEVVDAARKDFGDMVLPPNPYTAIPSIRRKAPPSLDQAEGSAFPR